MNKNEQNEQPPPYSAVNSDMPGVHHGYPTAPPAYQTLPPGYQPYTTQGFNDNVPSYGTIPTNISTTYVMPSQILVVGGCPACRVGVLEDDFTCLGILCAIAFFPLGILCCLAMKNTRCTLCGAYFG